MPVYDCGSPDCLRCADQFRRKPKVTQNLVFEPGVLSISEDGSGQIQFDESDVDFLPHDDRSGSYCVIKIDRSEMTALRDFFTQHLHKD